MTPKHKFTGAIAVIALSGQLLCAAFAQAPSAVMPPAHGGYVRAHKSVKAPTRSHAVAKSLRHKYPGGVALPAKKRRVKRKAALPPPPQTFAGKLASQTLAPGVVHKVHRGAMFINVLDVDLKKAAVVVKPVLAGNSFDTLDEVRDQAQKVKALAAINGNYFKKDGTPLGTLIIDGEWVSGPLYDRTCLGITRDGQILVDRVDLHGILTTSNPEAPSIWVNNINQPRRHGAHLIAYTRRWGERVVMHYPGTLVAVDAHGKVVAKGDTSLLIPAGGFVLSDSRDSAIARLNLDDIVSLSWHTNPAQWSNVVNAVSGGPVLVRDGKLYVDCQQECFAKAWTGSQIHARTAVGVTGDRHLLLATIEGPHTLYDVAKFFLKLGAVDAMNLDGGGSTTMVIEGKTVSLNRNQGQRRVASALAILPRSAAVDREVSDLSRLGVRTHGAPSAMTLSPAAQTGAALSSSLQPAVQTTLPSGVQPAVSATLPSGVRAAVPTTLPSGSSR